MAFNIDALHSEITAFLRNLNLFIGDENLLITDTTVGLLEETILAIDRLVSSAEISSYSGKNGSDFVFQLDKDHFELRRHIMCRLCLEQISMEENDVKAHQIKLTHVQHLKRIQKNQLSSIEPHVEKANVFGENGYAMVPMMPAQQNGQNTISNQITSQQETDIFTNDYDELNVFEDDTARKATKEAFTKSIYAPVGFSFDSSLYLIKMSGIPWTATKTELQAFLSEVNILNGISGIHFMIDEKKCSINQAYIQLETRKDYSVSKSYNNATMDGVYVKVMEGDIYDFMKMVTQPDYPDNQNVIRLKNVPGHCNEATIKAFFPGLRIRSVHFTRVNDRLEVFVKFNSCEDVELSLNIMGKKINDVYVKIYRSSEEQIIMVCSANDLNLSQLSLQSIEQASKGRSSNLSRKVSGEFTVLARGYAWSVTKEAVREFFANVSIVNGEEGITLYKNGAMETRFDAASIADLQKALAQNGKRMGSRIISVSKAI